MITSQNQLSEFEAKWALSQLRLQEQKEPMKAIALLARTAREHPEHPEAAFQVGEMAVMTGQLQKAKSWYRMAHRHGRGTEKAVALIRMAQVHAAMNQTDSARLVLNKVLVITTDSVLLRTATMQLNELNILSNN